MKTDILICLVKAAARVKKYLRHWFKLNFILLFLLYCHSFIVS